MSRTIPSLLATPERVAPWLVLAILVALSYAFFVEAPYLGFRYSSNSELVAVYVEGRGLRAGDRILSIDTVSWEQFTGDLTQTWIPGREAGDEIPLRFERDAEEQEITWTLPGATVGEIVQRVNSQWWLGYVFWLAGTATLFLVRPKDLRWLLLVAFNYLTAIWLTAGATSSWHVMGSPLVLRITVWLSVPVYLHLHWLFPNSLGRLPRPIVWAPYGLAVALAIAQWFQLLPSSTYLLGLLVALVGSVVLLLLHAVRRATDRRQVGFLALALGLVALPPVVITVAGFLGVALPGPLRGAAFLAFPALPGAYFFILYRRQLGRRLAPRANRLSILYLILVFTGLLFIIFVALSMNRFGILPSEVLAGAAAAMLAGFMTLTTFVPFLVLPALAGAYVPAVRQEQADLHFRANRLLAPFLFLVGLGLVLVLMILLDVFLFDYPGGPVVGGLLAGMFASAAVAAGYQPFRRFVERRLLGVALPPARLTETFAARITTCLEKEALASLLAEQVLPSLLVRQSAIVLPDETGQLEPFMTYGVRDADLPGQAEIGSLMRQLEGAGHAPPDGDVQSVAHWLRLVLPLKFGGRTIALWLLGRRDPDDLYSRAELPLFELLANQMAVALTNLVQMENLRALYRENIDRHEAERARLARALHDEVLSRLAVLALFAGEEIPAASQEAYESLTAQIRQTIAGLRPAMLQYGLHAALNELVDELSGRAAASPSIELDIPPSEARYPEPVEQHLFRIVQQAVENALKHAEASKITITGQLDPETVALCVADDGVGLEAGERPDVASLLASNHFGLAGMYERAALIGADLRIDSTPGEGTQIRVTWQNGRAA